MPELLIVLAILMIIFGPSRIAKLGKSLSQGIRELRASVRETQDARARSASSKQPHDHVR